VKAAIYRGPGKIAIEDVTAPSLPSGGLVVEVECCLLCGTDMKAYYIENPRIRPGIILGHEFVGRVLERDEQASGLAVGDRVTMATTIGCNECYLCKKGYSNLCEQRMCIGTDFPGALAERLAIPARAVLGGNVLPLPAGLSAEAGCLAEPLSCVINAQNLAEVGKGDTVVVVGAGPMGLLHLEAARAKGATRTAAVQRSVHRRELARQFADVVFSPEEAEAGIMNLTEGRGADVVIVTAPSPEAQEKALPLVGMNGRLSLFAGVPKDTPHVTLDSRWIHYRQIKVVGASDSTPRHVAEALALLASGRIRSELIITHRLPLERVVEGIEMMKRGESLKVLIEVCPPLADLS